MEGCASFHCEKSPAGGTWGMVVSNHPLASAAGVEMLASGGNAIDATVAALFTLSVVEPMMVGIFGGGMTHLRLPDGRHSVIDGLSVAPGQARPDMYEPVSNQLPDYLETVERKNAVGASAVAVPGNLMAWCETQRQFGRFSLGDVIEPAIRHATRGFLVTPYLSECVREAAHDLSANPEISRQFMPQGCPIEAGARLTSTDYAQTLRMIAQEGEGALYHGALGDTVIEYLKGAGGVLERDDLRSYRVIEREPVWGSYRDFEIVGPPPPSSGGVHVIEMLNILEGYDLASLGFGTRASVHLIIEALKIAFADRKAVTADPAFVDVPVARLLDKRYAQTRRAQIDTGRARKWHAGVALPESPDTTHLTVADRDGYLVASTQTINSTFGARLMVPGTGIIANNYMYLFDPHPGHTLSVAPGKRVTTSQAPVMVLRDGVARLALGLPGGLRIFGVVMQALINFIDHKMSLQEMVEAPRVWTQGDAVEVERGLCSSLGAQLTDMGHPVTTVSLVGGGMNAVAFNDDGTMSGAACWRADGTPIGLSGGRARSGARFSAE